MAQNIFCAILGIEIGFGPSGLWAHLGPDKGRTNQASKSTPGTSRPPRCRAGSQGN